MLISKDDYLTDDDIIMLDNTINLISTDEEITYEEEEDIEDKVDEIMTSSKVDKTMKESVSKAKKLKKKDANKQEFNMLKKEMYKHKNKLMKNEADENIVLLQNGMSVSEFASVLNVGGAEIIKKLMENGLMLSLNQPIDFENAEIIALDYKKTLKEKKLKMLLILNLMK